MTVVLSKLILKAAVISSVLSFSAWEALADVCSVLMYVLWAVYLLFTFVAKKTLRVDNTAKIVVILYASWFLFSQIAILLGLHPQGSSMGIASNLFLCGFFYVLGLNLNTVKSKDALSFLSSYFFGVFALTITQLFNLKDPNLYYLYGAKNQMGQMVSMAILLGFKAIPRHYSNLLMKLFFYAVSGLALFVLFMLRARSSIVAIAVVAVYSFIMIPQKGWRHYLTLIAAVLAVGLVVLFSGGFSYLTSMFVPASIASLSAQTGTGSNTGIYFFDQLLSGRLSIYILSLNEFFSSPLLGVGPWAYTDNFILHVLRSGGILSAIMLLPLSYGVLIRNIRKSNTMLKRLRPSDSYAVIFVFLRDISLYYFLISLMEGYPPLGPGSSVFFLWIMTGWGKQIVCNAKKPYAQQAGDGR